MDQRIYDAVLRHARRVVPGDPALEASDIAQGAYLKTLGRLDATRSEHEQVTFLCFAATQVAIDAGRRRRFVGVDPAALPEIADPRRDTAGEALARATEDEWADRLVALGPLCGPAVALVDGGGCSYAEAVAALGVPATTVKMRLWRGRQVLRGLLGGAG